MRLQTAEVGVAAYRKMGTTLPEAVIEAALAADGVIMGPAGMTDYPPREEGGINVPGTLRKRLDLYANLRPARSRPGVPDARPGLDCLIVRENTEGFYSDRNMFMGSAEFMPTPDVALSVRKITAHASKRIAHHCRRRRLRRTDCVARPPRSVGARSRACGASTRSRQGRVRSEGRRGVGQTVRLSGVTVAIL